MYYCSNSKQDSVAPVVLKKMQIAGKLNRTVTFVKESLDCYLLYFALLRGTYI